MEQIKVYIVNLGKYNEGEAVGEWFCLPVNFDNVKERLGLNEHYEEYAIHDYDNWPLKDKPEYTSIEKLNRMAVLINNLDDKYIPILPDMIEQWGNIEAACEHTGDIKFYDGCNDMGDVAAKIVVEREFFKGACEELKLYFNYEAYGRDLEINGSFVKTPVGYAEFPL